MGIFTVILDMLQGTWTASLTVLPALLLVFTGWAGYKYGADWNMVLGFVFDTAVPQSGEYVVASFALAGIIQYLVPGQGVAVGVGILGIGFFFYHTSPDSRAWEGTPVSTAQAAAYTAILVAAAAAVVTQIPVLTHVAATLYYAVLFWKV